jgi:hypothetical protein
MHARSMVGISGARPVFWGRIPRIIGNMYTTAIRRVELLSKVSLNFVFSAVIRRNEVEEPRRTEEATRRRSRLAAAR